MRAVHLSRCLLEFVTVNTERTGVYRATRSKKETHSGRMPPHARIVRRDLFGMIDDNEDDDDELTHAKIQSLADQVIVKPNIVDIEQVIDFAFPRIDLPCHRFPSCNAQTLRTDAFWSQFCSVLYYNMYVSLDPIRNFVCLSNLENTWVACMLKISISTSPKPNDVTLYCIDVRRDRLASPPKKCMELLHIFARAAMMVVCYRYPGYVQDVDITKISNDALVSLTKKHIQSDTNINYVQVVRNDLDPNTHLLTLLWGLQQSLAFSPFFQNYDYRVEDFPSSLHTALEWYFASGEDA